MHFILYKSSVLGFSLWMHTIKIAHGIRQTLSKLNLDALAKESGLRKRQSRKITPVNLVLALVAMASQGAWSLAKEAERIGFLADLIISKQSIRKCVMKASSVAPTSLSKTQSTGQWMFAWRKLASIRHSLVSIGFSNPASPQCSALATTSVILACSCLRYASSKNFESRSRLLIDIFRIPSTSRTRQKLARSSLRPNSCDRQRKDIPPSK